MGTNWIEILKLFQGNLTYMLIALLALIGGVIIYKAIPNNKIGNITAKKTTIEQTGTGGSSIGDIFSDDLKIKQK